MTFGNLGAVALNLGNERTHAAPRRLTADPAGRVLLAGKLSSGREVGKPWELALVVARLTRGGVPDKGFGKDGIVRIEVGAADLTDCTEVTGLEVDARGGILLGGMIGVSAGSGWPRPAGLPRSR